MWNKIKSVVNESMLMPAEQHSTGSTITTKLRRFFQSTRRFSRHVAAVELTNIVPLQANPKLFRPKVRQIQNIVVPVKLGKCNLRAKGTAPS